MVVHWSWLHTFASGASVVVVVRTAAWVVVVVVAADAHALKLNSVSRTMDVLPSLHAPGST